jgi:5-methylcytosine-specific restriction endonuclease McrA
VAKSHIHVVSTGCRAKKLSRSRHQATGTWCRPDLRLAVYLRDDFRCVHCGADLRCMPLRGRALDHVIPKSRGGGNDPGNVVTSCAGCNSRRQDRAIRNRAVRSRCADLCGLDIKPYRAMARALIARHGGYSEAMAKLAR